VWWVQEAFGDLICAVANHYPELVPARRYILAASALADELTKQRQGSREAGSVEAMHQILRVLGAPGCHVAAADAPVVVPFVLWDLGTCCGACAAGSLAALFPAVAPTNSAASGSYNLHDRICQWAYGCPLWRSSTAYR
jgi:hypothetical protein